MGPERFESIYPDTVRSEEIKKIISYVKEGKSTQLISIPGAGRSSILGLLSHNDAIRKKYLGDKKDIHFVLANFSEIRKRPLFDAIKFLFLSLTNSLKEKKMNEYNKINSLFKENLAYNDELVLFQALKEAIDYLTIERKTKIVFLFDRFDEYIPYLTPEFFTNLRSLRQRAKYSLSVVFSINRPLEDALEPTLLSDFYEFVAGNQIYVGLVDLEMTTFRVRYIEKISHKKLPSGVFEQIMKLTGGDGRLVKLSVEILLSNPKPKNLNDFLLSQESIKSALSELWRSFLPSEQSDLIEGNFDNENIRTHLENVGVVKNKKIQIPLFSEFIKTQYQKLKNGKNQFMYDENTNSIKNNDAIFSDQLTSSEFRLLKFLILNKDRIINREEIINFVWSDQKSTAGITDQAVDQLIFRLRQKIEENPNSPIHLQTIKGRGFRFLPKC